MNPRRRRGFLLVTSLCAATALADDVPKVDNHYAMPGKKAPQPVLKLDPALVTAVRAKVEECLHAEQDAKVTDEDRKLLDDFSREVASDLAPGLKFTSCQLDKPATPRCVQDVASLDCAMLAEPIIAAGWDRNLTPEAKAKVRSYAAALAKREGTCQGRQAEESAIVGSIRTDQLSVLIESEIVIGKCQLAPDKLADCVAQLADASCGEIAALNNRGKLTQFCDDAYTCTDVPVPDRDETSDAP